MTSGEYRGRHRDKGRTLQPWDYMPTHDTGLDAVDRDFRRYSNDIIRSWESIAQEGQS